MSRCVEGVRDDAMPGLVPSEGTNRGAPPSMAGLARGRRDPSVLCDTAVLILLALLVNLIHLGSKSIVHDESGSVLYAELSPISLFRVLATSDPNMSCYYVLLSVWVRIFGDGEAAVRFPSALLGAFAVGVAYLLGRRLFGRITGLVAGLLLALNPFMVVYAQTARAYTLLALLVTLSSSFFLRAIERPSRGNRFGYVITSVLAVYAHYFAVYVLAAHALILVVSKKGGALTREWFSVATAILVACLPALLFAYRSDAAGRIDWIGPPALGDVATVLTHFTGGSRLLLCGLLFGGLYATVLARRDGRWWPLGFVAACLFVPLALSFFVSLVKPMFLSRYLIVCLPFLVLIGAAGLTRLRPPAIAGVLVVLLTCLCVTRLFAFYLREGPEDWRAAATFVLDSTRDGDGFVFFPDYAHKPFDYYARQVGVAEASHLDERQIAVKERIWLVIRESDGAINRAGLLQVRSSLQETFRPAEQRGFAGVSVELYVR